MFVWFSKSFDFTNFKTINISFERGRNNFSYAAGVEVRLSNLEPPSSGKISRSFIMNANTSQTEKGIMTIDITNLKEKCFIYFTIQNMQWLYVDSIWIE